VVEIVIRIRRPFMIDIASASAFVNVQKTAAPNVRRALQRAM
jgi:hypothetical protein